MTTPLAEPAPRPQDWTVVRLGDVATFAKGAGLSKSALTPAGRHGCILYGELFTQYGAVIDAPRNRTNVSPSVTSEAGDVLMPTSDVTPRGLAKASALRNAGVALGGDILVIRPDLARVHPEFLAYAIRYDAAQVLSFVRGSTVFHLYAGDMRNFILALPPLDEQKAIATALEDCDQLIESLDDLIRKKQHVAEGVRTQLLTSTTRLPGFSDPWEIKRLNELGGLFLKGGGISKRDLTAHGAPCILYGEIYTHHHHWVRRLTSHIPYELTSRAVGLQAGDLLFAASGETADEIGKCVAYVGNSETAYAGGDIIIFRNAGIDPKFGGYALNSSKVQVQKSRLGQGATVSHISSNHLAQLELEIPTSREEQEAIAEVLADMDAEIDALVTQRDKTAQLKQAMMQELLTGRTRLS